jgi:TRAP-type uncharacterized transport system substrate-binding protein
MRSAYELVYAGYGPSADALQNGQIAGMSTPAGAPVGAVSRAFASMGDDITLLEFTDEQMAAANGDFDASFGRATPLKLAPIQVSMRTCRRSHSRTS